MGEHFTRAALEHITSRINTSAGPQNSLPLVVFNLNTPGDLVRIVTGEPVGTSVMNQLPRTGTGR